MTCDLCTLWQRFGCGARDLEQQATGLIFIKSKYFNKNHEKKQKNKQKHEQQLLKKAATKRKLSTNKPSPMPKRCRTEGGLTVAGGLVPLADEEMSTTVYERDGEREACTTRELDLKQVMAYHQKEVKSGQKVKRMGDELDPAEDDFVNAVTRHFRCYRQPTMLYFGNKASGKLNVCLMRT